MAEEEDLRSDEFEMLSAMYSEEELFFPQYGDSRYSDEYMFFELRLPFENPEPSGEPIPLELGCTLYPGYPKKPATFSIQCDRLRRAENDEMTKALHAAMGELDEGEMQVQPAVDWVKDNLAKFVGQASPTSQKAASASSTGPRPPKGFMREWCSFVSLYKDSYASGPNRFEVIISLARERGLNITGMGIAGKPGGLVAEGEENDLVDFMVLMRTEFFETLNPRGRKLTTRLQERWPLDGENDRFEAAEILDRIRNDVYKSTARADGKKLKPGEKERLEKQENTDRMQLDAWKAANGNREMPGEEVDQLLEAGPPTKCTTKGVYTKCGCEEPPTREEIEAQRVFKDFTVFTGKEGFEASYQEAGKIFKDLGRMYGFDAMFAYRFS